MNYRARIHHYSTSLTDRRLEKLRQQFEILKTFQDDLLEDWNSEYLPIWQPE